MTSEHFANGWNIWWLGKPCSTGTFHAHSWYITSGHSLWISLQKAVQDVFDDNKKNCVVDITKMLVQQKCNIPVTITSGSYQNWVIPYIHLSAYIYIVSIFLCRFSKLQEDREQLEQKHLHVLHILEAETQAKWQNIRQIEDLTDEVKKLKAEVNN